MRRMSTREFELCLAQLEWTHDKCATFFDVTTRTVARWRNGHTTIPQPVCMLLRLLAWGELLPEQAISVRPMREVTII
jgi:DNA-binding transcriptional regulator YiaG